MIKLSHDELFTRWMAALEARHLAELTFPEVSRALRALSSAYVERREKLAEGAALSGAGKRAAFALFYGPLHHLLIAHIVNTLPAATRNLAALLDLGCGTGASGAAWAQACDPSPRLIGIDRHPWALGEAAATYRAFGIAATVRQGDITRATLPKGPAAILAAFTLNELADPAREALLGAPGRARGARRPGPDRRAAGRLRRPLVETGGATRSRRPAVAAHEWRLRTELPPIVAKLDRAAGLNHREITGRSLWL